MQIWRDLTQDIAYAWRLARRSRATTTMIVGVLALGIGGSASVFTVLNNTLLRPMMLERVEELVRIDDVTVGPGGLGSETNISPLNVETLRREARTLASVTVQDAQWFVLVESGEPERLRGAGVSAGWHETLGVQPLLGRGFSAEELSAGARSNAILIGHDLWQRRFNRDRGVLGRSIQLETGSRTVVGVMPRGFRFPYEAEVWVPIDYVPTFGAGHYLLAFGRRAPDASPTMVDAELATISARLAAAHPETNDGWVMRAQPLRENLVRGAHRTAIALLATVAFLLLIACVNVAALMLARMDARRQELLVRAALGASRARQVRQAAVEALVLTLMGGAVGLLLTFLMFPSLGVLVPPVMSVELAQNELALDLRVFAFAGLLTFVTVTIAGILPALRSVPRDLQGALRENGRGGGGRRGRWPVRTLIVGEVTLALVLLIGSMAVILGFTGAHGGSAGYQAEQVLSLRLSLGDAAHPEPGDRQRAAAAILEQVRALPEVTDAALTTTNPRMSGWGAAAVAAGADAESAVPVQFVLVSPSYFETLSVGLEGADFTDGNALGGEGVAIVSRSLAERLWPGRDALGESVQPAPGAPGMRVVGVAADTRWGADPQFALYVPYAQVTFPLITREFTLLVRTSGEPMALVRAVRERIRQAAPGAPVFDVQPLTAVRSAEYEMERTGAAISVAFATFGTIIALLGIFGALMQAAIASRREHAVRQALGATPGQILRSHLLEVLALLAAGSVFGTLLGAALNGTIRGILADAIVVPQSSYVFVVAIIVTSGLLAGLAPALRAARVQPIIMLRDG